MDMVDTMDSSHHAQHETMQDITVNIMLRRWIHGHLKHGKRIYSICLKRCMKLLEGDYSQIQTKTITSTMEVTMGTTLLYLHLMHQCLLKHKGVDMLMIR